MSIEPEASDVDVSAVQAGLRAFNVTYIGEPAEERVQLFLAKLWIDESCRGRGHGTALLEAAERIGRERDCIGVHLDTFEYQARPFYEKLGYAVFGTLDDYPPGYCQYFLAKRFRGDGS